MSIARFIGVVFLVLFTAGAASSQTWTPLVNQPAFAASNPLLLTDGTVIAHNACAPDWWRLTPDGHGSYVNGTWSQIASLPAGYGPLYFSSAVLPDGRVIVEGGEYNFCNAVWTTLGAIYDPIADSWTAVNPPAGWTTIGDAQSVVLANGTYMQANCCTPETALFNAKKLTWTPTGAGKADVNDEEGWTLLPNGNVLTVDAYVFSYQANGTNSELYNPITGTWSSAGSTGVQLWDSYPNANKASYEVGPAVLRADGTVFATGANGAPHASGHTSIYDTHSGTWTPAPDFPADAVEAAAGSRPVTSRRIEPGGYGRVNAHWHVRFADGTTGFVKQALTEAADMWLRKERRVYESVRGAFVPALRGAGTAGPTRRPVIDEAINYQATTETGTYRHEDHV